MKLRDLVALARERLKDRAADLKTREELEAALFGSQHSAAPEATPGPAASEAPRERPVVVTRDFFIRK